MVPKNDTVVGNIRKVSFLGGFNDKIGWGFRCQNKLELCWTHPVLSI